MRLNSQASSAQTHFARLTDEYAWALWLAAPLAVTVLAALWIWWRGRSRGVPTARSAIAAHHRYLDSLQDATQGRAKAQPEAEGRAEGRADDESQHGADEEAQSDVQQETLGIAS